MEKIQEVIIVEGKRDTQRLKEYFDCDTIETHGLGLNKETIEYIQTIAERRGVIIFTDPDTPGEKIRQRLNQAIPSCKNAFVLKEDAKTSKKVGIEHASKEVLEEALKNVVTYDEERKSITAEEFRELGLSGKKDSQTKREKVAKEFHLGKANAKTLLKRLNYAGINKEEIEKIL